MSTSRVFISYTHDSPEHMTRVLGLCNRLRREGVDCDIDRYHPAPPEGWAAWMAHSIAGADFVLVICTEVSRKRYDGEAEEGVGKGAKWEGTIIRDELYESESQNTKFVPVIPSGGKASDIPKLLRSTTHYELERTDGYEQLYRRLTGQIEVEKPELGKQTDHPSLNVEWSSIERPEAGAVTIGFVSDLLPNEADIYEASRAVAEGGSVSIHWSDLNEDLFERYNVRRPDLRRQLAEHGVEEGYPMAKAIEMFDRSLHYASLYRDRAADRIPLMWSGMNESPLWGGESQEAFREALLAFLVLTNLYALRSLGMVQFKEDYRELPDGITPNETWTEVFQRPAIVEAFRSHLPVWAADVELAGESLYVYAPKDIAQNAYTHGAGAGLFMRKYLVPQVEVHLLERDNKKVVYDPESVSIHKLRNEHFEEALAVDEAFKDLEL
jgi:hypothetical protein